MLAPVLQHVEDVRPQDTGGEAEGEGGERRARPDALALVEAEGQPEREERQSVRTIAYVLTATPKPGSQTNGSTRASYSTGARRVNLPASYERQFLRKGEASQRPGTSVPWASSAREDCVGRSAGATD